MVLTDKVSILSNAKLSAQVELSLFSDTIDMSSGMLVAVDTPGDSQSRCVNLTASSSLSIFIFVDD